MATTPGPGSTYRSEPMTVAERLLVDWLLQALERPRGLVQHSMSSSDLKIVSNIVSIGGVIFSTLMLGIAVDLWSKDGLVDMLKALLRPLSIFWRDATMVADLASMHIEAGWLSWL